VSSVVRKKGGGNEVLQTRSPKATPHLDFNQGYNPCSALLDNGKNQEIF